VTIIVTVNVITLFFDTAGTEEFWIISEINSYFYLINVKVIFYALL